jgi:hypothetical protein
VEQPQQTVIVRPKVPTVIPSATPRSVILPCVKCRTTVRHVFVASRLVPGAAPGFEQVFGCTSCQTERRYGLLSGSSTPVTD